MTRIKLGLFLACSVAVACGDDSDADDTAGASSTGDAGDDTMDDGESSETEAADGSSTDDEVAWADMDSDQRFNYMAQVVLPQMQALFQEYDAERFASFSCATCHGADADMVAYQMPNGVLPLDPAGIPDLLMSDEAGAQFMVQDVWPQMAELLGEEPFDPETGEGFSCLRCHESL